MKISTKILIGFLITCFVIIPAFQVTLFHVLGDIFSTIDNIATSALVFAKAEDNITQQLDQLDSLPETQINPKLIDNARSTIEENYLLVKNTINNQLMVTTQTQPQKNVLQSILSNLNQVHQEILQHLDNLKFNRHIETNTNLQIQEKLLKITAVFESIIKSENASWQAGMGRLAAKTASFVISTFIAIFIVAFLIAHSIAKRLNNLIKTIQIAKDKKYKVKIEDNYGDELTVLAHSFNDMMTSLSISIEYITSLLKIMPNIFIVTTHALIIKDVNQAGLVDLGYQKHELLNQPLATLIPQISTLSMDPANPSKTFMRHKDGDELPVYVSSDAIHNIEDNTKEFIFVAQDISDLLAAENQMITNSRQAGMADTATGILHNIGNIINSMNVSASVLDDTIAGSNVQKLAKLVTNMEQHKESLLSYFSTEKNSKAMRAYLLAISNSWLKEKDIFITELDSIAKTINHIHNVITMQQMMNA